MLILIMSVLVKLTMPKRLVEEARAHKEEGHGHEHMSAAVAGETWRARLANPEARIKIAQNFAMEWRMACSFVHLAELCRYAAAAKLLIKPESCRTESDYFCRSKITQVLKTAQEPWQAMIPHG